MKTKMYAHGNKESNLEGGINLGLTGNALNTFMYALYEVEFEVDVDECTGNVTILKVNGRELKQYEN